MRTFINSREMAMVLALDTLHDAKRQAAPRTRRRVRRTRRDEADGAAGHA